MKAIEESCPVFHINIHVFLMGNWFKVEMIERFEIAIGYGMTKQRQKQKIAEIALCNQFRLMLLFVVLNGVTSISTSDSYFSFTYKYYHWYESLYCIFPCQYTFQIQ